MKHTSQHSCTNANKTLGFLSGYLVACPQEIKESAYKAILLTLLVIFALIFRHKFIKHNLAMVSVALEDQGW